MSEDFRTIKRFAAPNPWDDPNFGMESGESPDEEGVASVPYFDELMNTARQVDDPELSQQLEVLAELYRYSLQIGGGYATIARAINNLKNMYGDGSDSDIEDILNGMTKELAKAAGGLKLLSGNDNPSFVQRLAQLKQDIENRTQSGRSEALDAYNEEIGGQDHGAQTEESEEDLAQAGLTPDEAEIINPAALGFDNKDDPKTNKGWHTVGNGRAYKNWKEYYENERLSYQADELSEQNEDTRKILEQLIELLPRLSKKTEEALNLSNALKSDVADPAAETQMKSKLQTMRQELQQLKQMRQLLKNKIRSTQLQKEQQKFSEEETELSARMQSSADPERKEKARRALEVIKQKKALNALALSNDVYKAKERNYRLEMVHQMSGGAWPSQEWIDKQQQKIDAAFRLRISKAKYDRTLTEQRGKQEGREAVPTAAPQRGGAREMVFRGKQKDFTKETFPGFLKKLRDLNNTATADARKYIMRPKEKGDPKLEEYVERVSAAIRKKDTNAKYQAINALKEAIKQTLVSSSSLKGYMQVLRLSPHFKKIEEELFALKNKQTEGGAWQLSEDEKQKLINTLSNINRITELYSKYYQQKDGLHAGPQQQPYPFFKGVVTILSAIKDYAIGNMFSSPTEQSAEKVGAQRRMELLAGFITNSQNPIWTGPGAKEYKSLYDRRLTEERARHQGQDFVPTKAPYRGGGILNQRTHLYNLTVADFSGIVHKMQESINSGVGTLKQRLVTPRFGGDPALKTYVDAVSKAIARNDTQAKYQAISALKAAIASHLDKDPSAKMYEKGVRLLPYFRQLKDELKDIASWETNGQLKLGEAQKQRVINLIKRAERLQKLYEIHYKQPGKMDISFGPAVEKLALAAGYLKTMLDTGETNE